MADLTRPLSVAPDDKTNCACGHSINDHAQYQWSCFNRDCDCVEFRWAPVTNLPDDDVRAVWLGEPPTATPDDSPFALDTARKAVNTIVRDLQARGYNGPKTLKDYMEAQDALVAAVRAEAEAENQRLREALDKVAFEAVYAQSDPHAGAEFYRGCLRAIYEMATSVGVPRG